MRSQIRNSSISALSGPSISAADAQPLAKYRKDHQQLEGDPQHSKKPEDHLMLKDCETC